jgi:hypothetical protein
MAGYLGSTLPKKLGIKAGHKVCLLDAPRKVWRDLDQEHVRLTHDLRLPPVDVVVLFVDSLADLERRFADIAARLHPQGGFWVAWRTRRGAGVTEDVVRRIALAAGMVDNKACTIDPTWSGLRLVLRNDIRDAVMYRAEPPPMSRRMRRPAQAARLVQRGHALRSSGSTQRRLRARASK